MRGRDETGEAAEMLLEISELFRRAVGEFDVSCQLVKTLVRLGARAGRRG
jgi:hypothetical protein